MTSWKSPNDPSIENGIYTTKFVVQRIVLIWDDKIKILQWIERIKDWIVYADTLVDTCDRFSLCGPYGIVGVKVPDTRWSWYDVNMTLGECETACKRNCSCTGYGSLDIRNGGTGCLLWFVELLNTREFDAVQDIYIRVEASELEGILFASKFGLLLCF
ncbi:hypothetical protein L1987_17737 [Smallanthus sonchifolius]|uniref:Uncharacterized protein n=1 Tax=Smallanthus sonchifolius TaxID=185202 RepID=A0ACB9IXM7_9ASTR|nr:hypothetical protein L1987_17737 [Smallanthus sonchifolius]